MPNGVALAGLTYLIVVVAIAVGLFFLFRFLLLWYWRVNEVVDTLGRIEAHLQRLSAAMAPVPVPAAKPSSAPTEQIPAGPLTAPSDGVSSWVLPRDVALLEDSPMPSLSLRRTGIIHRGASVQILSRRPGWVKVQAPTGAKGWVTTD